MGLLTKVKNILFDEDEEDFTSQIKITPDMREEDYEDHKEEPVKKTEVKKEEPVQVKEVKEQPSERETFKNDSTFPFFDDFDENEFNNSKPKAEVKAPVQVREERKIEPHRGNVLQYETRKRTEKRTDFGRYERTEITETVERKRFKPSPIISPVYGILNQDYKKDDIKKREDLDELNVDTVRNKAFGEKKEEVKKEVKEDIKPKTTFYEEEETVTITIPEEKERKVKTIDELLEDTSDIVVDVDRDLKSDLDIDDFEDLDRKTSIDETSSYEEDAKIENDTLENDLFDLIDSMYDSSEDGE